MTKISKAAEMAGDWWAKRLDAKHVQHREAFAAAVALRVQEEFDGTARWGYEGKKKGDGKARDAVFTDVDYDPQGLMLDAVREVIDPACRGFGYSARGILPQKHSLDVHLDRLVPKEGYGRWTAEIRVPK